MEYSNIVWQGELNMKSKLTDAQLDTYLKIKEILNKYDESNFSEKMIFFEDLPFLELSRLMDEIGDGSNIIPKTKLFVKKLLGDWKELYEELKLSNQYRIDEEQNPSRNKNGFEFSAISHLYKFSCRIFRKKLKEYTDYIEKKYKTEKEKI